MNSQALELNVIVRKPNRKEEYGRRKGTDDIINPDVAVGTIRVGANIQTLIAKQGVFNPNSLKWNGLRPFTDHEKVLACAAVMEGVARRNFGYKTDVTFCGKTLKQSETFSLYEYYLALSEGKKAKLPKFAEVAEETEEPEVEDSGNEESADE